MQFLGKSISGGLTIPSGIITTQISVLARMAREIPQLGVLTTKSTGPTPRAGHREPVFTAYAPGCFINAVGLTNPGAAAFAAQLQTLDLPSDRFLLTSIFGGTVAEFVAVAQTLAPYSDGLELNLSCPNAAGFGMAMGQDPEMVAAITQAVKRAVKIPVIPKLTPNAPNLREVAVAAVNAGADALCAINSVGPGYYTVDGYPVLTNVYGGLCGQGILPLGLKCVREIAEAVNVPLIACGGVRNVEHVRAYRHAGASVVGVGTGLTGLNTAELQAYFAALQADLDHDTNTAETLLKTPDLRFTKYTLRENRGGAADLAVLAFDRELDIQPGQFVFVWLPGKGEKPFSVLDDQPLTLAVQRRGCFSEILGGLQAGDTVYVRGPYGVPVNLAEAGPTALVCGGTGMAAVYPIAKALKNTTLFVGARDRQHLFYLDEARQIADVRIATEDGSLGQRGRVTDALQTYLQQTPSVTPHRFFNCGPEAMIAAAAAIEQRYAPPERILHSIDYVTKCGVGICGSCATPDGRRACIDGPFLQ